jgi:glucosamine--fructose-6-phosphate aminotransferase (isomerizing)
MSTPNVAAEPTMSVNASYMRQEIEEIPEAAARFLASSKTLLADAGAALCAADPVMVATIARGSSDHAATFLKYAIELTARVPVASLGPSVMSI